MIFYCPNHIHAKSPNHRILLSDTYLKAQATEPFSIPKYEFAVGTAVRSVVQDLMTPEDASRMAQALYDAADPVCR